MARARDAGIMPEMTERSPDERPTACPFLAFEDDRDYRSDRPDHRHRCFAEAHPAPRAISHQELFCLGGAFGECPTFASWAAREAAAVRRPTIRRPETSATPRGAYPAGTAYPAGAASPGDAGTAPPSPTASRDWQAPPPWAAEGAAGAAARDVEPSPTAGRGPDLGQTPAFLAGREERRPAGAPASGRPPVSATTAGGGTAAAGTAAAYGSASLIGGSASAASAEDFGGVPHAGAGRAASRPVSGRSSAPPPPRPSSSDSLWTEPDIDVPAEDDAWVDPVEAAAAARVARASRSSSPSSSRFGLGRSKPTASGQARPLPQRAADPDAPAWERPRRFDSYPTIKSGGVFGGGGASRRVPRILVWAGLLAVAALALFLLPPIFLGGGGAPRSSPTPSASADATAAPSVSPTPEPSPTPLTYKVKSGDTLSGIAAKYKLAVADIIAANPDLKDPNQLQIGDTLVIPLPVSSVIPDAGTPAQSAAP